MRIIIVAFSILFFANCKTSKSGKVAQNSKVIETNANAKEQLSADSYRYIVSFISIGGGPDIKLLKKFKDLLDSYGQQVNKQISPEIYNWGREGESDYCFKLSELSVQQQKEFIDLSNKIFTNSKLVRASENEACRHKR